MKVEGNLLENILSLVKTENENSSQKKILIAYCGQRKREKCEMKTFHFIEEELSGIYYEIGEYMKMCNDTFF